MSEIPTEYLYGISPDQVDEIASQIIGKPVGSEAERQAEQGTEPQLTDDEVADQIARG